jgi:hypothetical protein
MATWDRAITIVADARAEKQRWEDIMESIRHKLFLSIPALAIVSPLSRSKRVSPSDFPPCIFRDWLQSRKMVCF